MGEIVPHRNNGGTDVAPSRKVRAAFGARRLAEICGLTTEAVRKWDRPTSKGGCGGLIPSQYHARLLAEAQGSGLELRAEDLIAEPVR